MALKDKAWAAAGYEDFKTGPVIAAGCRYFETDSMTLINCVCYKIAPAIAAGYKYFEILLIYNFLPRLHLTPSDYRKIIKTGH